MPDDAAQRQLDECLGPLMTRLQRAQSAYRFYLDDGKTFRGALALRRANDSLIALLLDKAWLLPELLQEQATLIVTHLDIWAALWDHHREATQPGLDDEFAFPNEHRFPADAEAQLKAHYESLRGSVG